MAPVLRVDGALVDGHAVTLDASDPVLTDGDGWFETVRVDDGVARQLDRHVDRLMTAARRSGVVGFDVGWVREVLEQAVGDVDAPLGRVRGTFHVDASGRRRSWTLAGPWVGPTRDDYARGVELVVVEPVHPGNGAWGKSMSRQWARTASRLAGSAEPVVLDAHGCVVESARAALVWRRSERWFTAPAMAGPLESTTLAALVDAGLVVDEEAVSPDELAAADAVVLLSSLRLAMGVRAFAGRSWGQPDVAPARFRRALLGGSL